MLEKDIQAGIIDYLHLQGFYVLRTNSGAVPVEYKGKSRLFRGTPAGTPDIICCCPKDGKLIGIEVKAPGKRPTELQRQTLQAIKRAGGIGIYVTSLDELIKDLVILGYA